MQLDRSVRGRFVTPPFSFEASRRSARIDVWRRVTENVGIIAHRARVHQTRSRTGARAETHQHPPPVQQLVPVRGSFAVATNSTPRPSVPSSSRDAGPTSRAVYAPRFVMLPDMAAALQATEDFLVEVGVETQPAEQRCGPMATPRVALV